MKGIREGLYKWLLELDMKLKRIKNIKAYKSFQVFSWQRFLNNESFHDDVNILYGENGSGKSSIVNILKDLSENKDFIEYKPAETCLAFDGGDRKYTEKNGWDKKLGKGSILFFDREFVDNNVHLGRRRGTTQGEQEQTSGKMIIEFDGEAIKLREIRDNAKEARDKKEQELKQFRAANTNSLNFVLADNEKVFYDRHNGKTALEINEYKQELDNQKEAISAQLKGDRKKQEKASDIQKIEHLSNLEIEFVFSPYETYQAVFNFDLIEKVQNDTERTLTDKIKTNKSFFETGLKIREVHQGKCPFCQSSNEEPAVKRIIDLYEQIYDEAYKKQKQDFERNQTDLISEVAQILEILNDLSSSLKVIFRHLQKLAEQYEIPDVYSVNDEEKHEVPDIQKLVELKDKIANLTKPSNENIQTLYNQSQSEFENLKGFFKLINGYIEQKNQLIAGFQSENTDEMLKTRIIENTEKLNELNRETNFINEGKIGKQQKKEQDEKQQNFLIAEVSQLREKHTDSLNKYKDYCSTKAFSDLLSKIQGYFQNFKI